MLRDFTYIDDIVEGVLRVIDHTPVSDTDWNTQVPDPVLLPPLIKYTISVILIQ